MGNKLWGNHFEFPEEIAEEMHNSILGFIAFNQLLIIKVINGETVQLQSKMQSGVRGDNYKIYSFIITKDDFKYSKLIIDGKLNQTSNLLRSDFIAIDISAVQNFCLKT